MVTKGHPWLFVHYFVLSARTVRWSLEYLQRPMRSGNPASYISVLYILAPPLSSHTTAEELKKVKDAQIYSETICRVRDLFIFQAYTGISYADLAKFNFKRDVQKRGNKYVILDIRLKTEENYFIVLLSPAMEILKKYDYVLPIISNQQYNLRLKIVADYAGLDRNLTVHMSRHTFATMCLNNGVKMENVSKMLGHTNVRTTQQYAKVLNAEVEKDFEMLERILS